MRMMVQVLPPGVEHGNQPERGAEMLGVGGDEAQRLGCRLEQDAVDDGLVLKAISAIGAGTVKTTWK